LTESRRPPPAGTDAVSAEARILGSLIGTWRGHGQVWLPTRPATDYIDRRGRPKHVRYWEMRPLSGAFTANDEVDEVQWLAMADARPRLTYAHDRLVLDAFARFAG